LIRGQERLYLLQVEVLLVAVLVTHVEKLFALQETGADARDFSFEGSDAGELLSDLATHVGVLMRCAVVVVVVVGVVVVAALASIVAVTVVAVGLVLPVAISAVCTLSGAARGVPVLSPRGSGGAGVGSRRAESTAERLVVQRVFPSMQPERCTRRHCRAV
jgi:hypothetical protein